jgi:hypothetical protein
LYKIADRSDPLSRDCAAVYGRHVPLGFGLDVCGRVLPACRNLADLMGNPFPLDTTANVSALPIANIPAVPYSDNLSLLLSLSHVLLSFLSFAFTGCNSQLRDPAAFRSGQFSGSCLPALAGDLGDLGFGKIPGPSLSTKTAKRLCVWVWFLSHRTTIMLSGMQVKQKCDC